MKRNELMYVCVYDMKKVNQAIERLPKREAEIIKKLYGLGKEKKCTALDLSIEYKCTKDDILNTRDIVLNKLRHVMKSARIHENVLKCEDCIGSKLLVYKSSGETGLRLSDISFPIRISQPINLSA